jgi:hypothetical protein
MEIGQIDITIDYLKCLSDKDLINLNWENYSLELNIKEEMKLRNML